MLRLGARCGSLIERRFGIRDVDLAQMRYAHPEQAEGGSASLAFEQGTCRGEYAVGKDGRLLEGGVASPDPEIGGLELECDGRACEPVLLGAARHLLAHLPE